MKKIKTTYPLAFTHRGVQVFEVNYKLVAADRPNEDHSTVHSVKTAIDKRLRMKQYEKVVFENMMPLFDLSNRLN